MLNFDEHFYLVVLERLQSQVVDGGSRLHMWRLTVSLQTFLPTGVAVTADGEFFLAFLVAFWNFS